MAIYGFGAYYEGVDVTERFLQQGGAYLGWSHADAIFFHEILSRIAIGDLVFIKSFTPVHGLHVKAVGLVVEPANARALDADLGSSVGVQWVWGAPLDVPLVIGRLDDRGDQVRTGALYEEMNPEVRRRLVGLLLD